MKPPIPITDKRFAYTPAHATNIRERFERVRAGQKQQTQQVAVVRKIK